MHPTRVGFNKATSIRSNPIPSVTYKQVIGVFYDLLSIKRATDRRRALSKVSPGSGDISTFLSVAPRVWPPLSVSLSSHPPVIASNRTLRLTQLNCHFSFCWDAILPPLLVLFLFAKCTGFSWTNSCVFLFLFYLLLFFFERDIVWSKVAQVHIYGAFVAFLISYRPLLGLHSNN